MESKGKPEKALIYIQFEDFFPRKCHNGSCLISMHLYDANSSTWQASSPVSPYMFPITFFFPQGFLAADKHHFKHLECCLPSLSFSWVPHRSAVSRFLLLLNCVRYPGPSLRTVKRAVLGRAWIYCLMLKPVPWVGGFMLKLNGIMKRFVLRRTAFVSGSPATYNGLPLSSKNPPSVARFLRYLLDGFFSLTPYVSPSCYLCS